MLKGISSQLAVILCLFLLCTCSAKKEDFSVIPPVTSPLSRDYIGYGVINASFTHICAEPSEDSPSLGYLRRGSLVRIIKRQTIRTRNEFVTWILTDGNLSNAQSAWSGWLKEEFVDIYSNESQAKTASESMPK
ncbi:MAG: hypothetical protein FWD26_06775 [Treponema sp.]|nr:hypothetical protein [Treponema sp.]